MIRVDGRWPQGRGERHQRRRHFSPPANAIFYRRPNAAVTANQHHFRFGGVQVLVFNSGVPIGSEAAIISQAGRHHNLVTFHG